MRIHVFDNDTRQFSDIKNYASNHGPFSHLAIKLNEELKKLNLYASPNEADYVGFCTSLDTNFKYKNKKSFILHCWETINILPLEITTQLGEQRVLGMSDQTTNLWKKIGVDARTVYAGCDTEFWKQTQEKYEIFTFLHINNSTVRSGLDLTLQAFELAFPNNKNVKLIIKNNQSSPVLLQQIRRIQDNGVKIEHIDKSLHDYEIRDLFSRSHVCLNVMRMAAFSLPSLECSACGCLCVTGDVQANNEIISSLNGVLLKPTNTIPIYSKIKELTSQWGLQNNYPPFHYQEVPLFYDFNVHEYADLLNKIYQNWSEYSKIDTRSFVVKEWSWAKSAKNLAQNIL